MDECITFFFAGSQTTSVTSENLICNLMKQPKLMKKCRDEIEKELVKPFPAGGDIVDHMTLENVSNLDYIQMCFSEAMRWMPPVWIASTGETIAPITVGGIHLRKGD